MRGKGETHRDWMGSGVRGSTHLLFRFDKAWKLLWEAVASGRYMQPLFVSLWLQQGQLHQGWGACWTWHLFCCNCWQHRATYVYLHRCQSNHLMKLDTRIVFFLSSCKWILLSVFPSLSLTDINAYTHMQLSLLVLSYYLTEHQQILFFFFAASMPSSRWHE